MPVREVVETECQIIENACWLIAGRLIGQVDKGDVTPTSQNKPKETGKGISTLQVPEEIYPFLDVANRVEIPEGLLLKWEQKAG